MAVPVYERTDAHVVTNVEQDIEVTPMEGIEKKAWYLLNDGASPVNYKLYVSPTGITTNDLNAVTGRNFTSSEVEKEWAEIDAGTLTAGAKLTINLDLITANYIKVTAYVPGGYGYGPGVSELKAWFMKGRHA